MRDIRMTGKDIKEPDGIRWQKMRNLGRTELMLKNIGQKMDTNNIYTTNSSLPNPLREEKSFSQRAFSIYCLENKGYIIWKLDEKKNIPCFDGQGN